MSGCRVRGSGMDVGCGWAVFGPCRRIPPQYGWMATGCAGRTGGIANRADGGDASMDLVSKSGVREMDSGETG